MTYLISNAVDPCNIKIQFDLEQMFFTIRIVQVAILLLAGGMGSRFGSITPKQYICLNGTPLLIHCLNSLSLEPRIHCVLPVLAGGDKFYSDAIAGREFPFLLMNPVRGGSERAESMAHGLAALPPEVEWVAIHDAARPVPSRRLLGDVFDAAEKHGAAIPGISVTDTIKQVNEAGKVVSTPDRKTLRAVQTPQVARREWFDRAVRAHFDDLSRFTDDAALLEAAGFDVYVSQGDPKNRKITTREDLQWLENYITCEEGR